MAQPISALRQRSSPSASPKSTAPNMDDVLQWASEDKLSAPVHAVYPLEQIALKALANREAKGKILLRP
jgi:NADPH:quinone reductase-like Zn-dependent oxidoreductase